MSRALGVSDGRTQVSGASHNDIHTQCWWLVSIHVVSFLRLTSSLVVVVYGFRAARGQADRKILHLVPGAIMPTIVGHGAGRCACRRFRRPSQERHPLHVLVLLRPSRRRARRPPERAPCMVVVPIHQCARAPCLAVHHGQAEGLRSHSIHARGRASCQGPRSMLEGGDHRAKRVGK